MNVLDTILVNDGTTQVSKPALKAYLLNGTFINVKHLGAIGDGTTNDTAAINDGLTALGANGGVLYFPPSTGAYVYIGQLVISGASKTLKGCGKDAQYLRITAAGYGLKITGGSHLIEDLGISFSDSGVDFNTAGNTNSVYSVINRCKIFGPLRGATSTTSTKTGVRFQRMTASAYGAFFNSVTDTDIVRFDRGVDFDAPTGNAGEGGNANLARNLHMEGVWTGYIVRGNQCRIEGGTFHQSGGNSSSDYMLGCWVTNGAFYNYFDLPAGEPGVNSKAYEYDVGTQNNTHISKSFNFDLGGADNGSNIPFSYRTFGNLQENRYYTLDVIDGLTTNYVDVRFTIDFVSRNAALVSQSSGRITGRARRTTTITAAWDAASAQATSGAGAVSFVGFEVSGHTLRAVFFVGNNGGSNVSGSLSVQVEGVVSNDGTAVRLGANISAPAVSNPATIAYP